MADDITPAQDPEPEEQSTSSGQVTRRQFLIGAVVGVAGATGVLTLARPAPAPEQAKPAAPQTTTQAATTASPLVDGPKLVTLNVNGLDYVLAVPPQATLFEVLKRDLGLTG